MKFLSFFTLYIATAFAALDPSKSIVFNAQQVPTLSTLVTILSSPSYAPVLNALNNPGTFTVFAPTNEAFTKANIDTSKAALVTQVLMYHVLPNVVKSSDLAALQFPRTLMVDSNYVTLGGKAQVLSVAKNGASVSINFGIPGDANYMAHVTLADVQCSNGVVHLIDRVLMLPNTTSVTAGAAGLTQLVRALIKADLVRAVDQTASVTIFAPTDAAMIAAGWERLDIATLRAVLSYHVVPAVAYSTDLQNNQQLQTEEGKSVTVHLANGGVKINDANVVKANVLVKNGVVHVIDKVLMPPAGKMGKGKLGKAMAKGKKGKQGKM